MRSEPLNFSTKKDERLRTRVSDVLERFKQPPQSIQAFVRYGHVSLVGTVFETERTVLLAKIQEIRGVRRVEDCLYGLRHSECGQFFTLEATTTEGASDSARVLKWGALTAFAAILTGVLLRSNREA